MSADEGDEKRPRKPLPRPSGSRKVPPPTRRTLEGPPPPPKPAEPVVAPLVKPAEPAPAPPVTPVPPPAPAPAPEIAAAPAPAPAPVDDEPLPPLTWQLPRWLRSRRAQIALGVTAAILLIGLVAALAGDDDAPPTPAAVASAERIDGGSGAAPPADAAPAPAEPEPADVEVDDAEEAPTAAATEKSRPRRERAEKKAGAGRKVRLGVKSDPPGASIRVDGEPVDGGSVMVAGGSTVKVTATKRGYRRVTRSVDVGKGTSIVIKLDEM